MRIGVDVGGTNTDAVVMDGATVLASIKAPTTADVGAGVVAAIEGVLARSKVAPETITGVMIGTTQFTNAIVERRRLVPVAIVRLALPATESLNPLIDWPRDLVDTIGRNVYMAKGGYEVDGREISPLDEADIARIARDIAAKGLQSIAVSSVFAPLNSAQEDRAAEIIRAEHPDAQITLSNEIGRVGLIERENARGDERGPGSALRQGGGLLPRGIDEAQDRRALLHQPERRHVDERGLRRALPGADLRLGPH